MKTRSKSYWERRAAERMVDYQARAEQTANEIGSAYFLAQQYLDSEARKVFSGFQKGFDLSAEDAERYLNAVYDTEGTVYQQLRRAVSEMPDGDEKLKAMAQISAPAYQYRIKRLEQVNENIALTCNRLYKTELAADKKFFSKAAADAYNRSVFDLQKGTGISAAFEQIPQSKIDQILKRNWSGEHYSSRIWGNTQELAANLKRDLTAGLLSGKSEQEMAAEIAERCKTSFNNARRLVRTETTYITAQADLEALIKAGVEKYEFSAVLDSKTSKLCSALDGKIFSVKSAQPGKNLPPVHPWCRSCILAVLPSEEELDKIWNDIADEIGADVDFDEWVNSLEKTPDGKLKYVKKNIDKSAESGIMKVGSDNVLKVNTGGRRNEEPLTNEQIDEVKQYAISLGMAEERIYYVDYDCTGYGCSFDLLRIGTDAYPSLERRRNANSNISMRGAIAHEIIGHRQAALSNRTQSDDVLEEAQASIRAAKFTPDLTASERITLYRDAITRLKNVGVKLKQVKQKLFIFEE